MGRRQICRGRLMVWEKLSKRGIMARISIIGGGSWGIALAVLLSRNGHEITIWSALENEIAMLKEKHEHRMLPGVVLPDNTVFTTREQEAVQGKDLLVMAVASSYTRSTARRLKELVENNQKILNVAKGIEVMSGPSHAEEVGRGLPTTIVVGAGSRATAEYIQNLFMNEVFRVYISPDILGMELGGSLKNVVALAAGIADGLGYGDNTKAALITRGITEIARLGTAMGGRFETFCGLTGIGDLIVTCASMQSKWWWKESILQRQPWDWPGNIMCSFLLSSRSTKCCLKAKAPIRQ